MSEVINKTLCQECKNDLNEDRYCFHCDKIVKAEHFLSVTDKIELWEGVKGKIKRFNKRPHIEFKEEDQKSGDPRIKNGVHKSMHIDRDNDRYFQTVTDRQDSKVLHFEDMKLSEHKKN